MVRRKNTDPLEGVSADDALTVLRRLLAARPELGSDVTRILADRAADVSRDEIAAWVADDILSLGIEEVWDRSGRTRDGYVDPGEAALEMIQEAIANEVDRMERMLARGEHRAAAEILVGIVVGVWRAGQSSSHPVVLEVGNGLESVTWTAVNRWARVGGAVSVLTTIERAAPGTRRTLESALKARR